MTSRIAQTRGFICDGWCDSLIRVDVPDLASAYKLDAEERALWASLNEHVHYCVWVNFAFSFFSRTKCEHWPLVLQFVSTAGRLQLLIRETRFVSIATPYSRPYSYR